MTFHHRLTARFFDIDRAGIVFFGTLYAYCHATFEELLCAMFGPDMEKSFLAGSWMMPLVHSEADYSRPVRMGDRLIISLEVAHVGKGSITFAYDLTGEDGVHRAKARLVHAFVDPTFSKCAMPETFHSGLQRLGLIA